jgi:hypothetical protein
MGPPEIAMARRQIEIDGDTAGGHPHTGTSSWFSAGNASMIQLDLLDCHMA